MIPHANNEKEPFDDIDLSYNNDKIRKFTWHDRILLNGPLKIAVAIILFGMVIPVLLYHYVFSFGIELPPSDGLSFGSCLVHRESRLPCGVGNVSHEECHSECCYDFNTNFCFHRFPSRFSYLVNQNWTDDVILTPRIATVPYRSQASFPAIRLSFDEVSATHLSLNFYVSDEPVIGRKVEDKAYKYEVSRGELHVVVNSAERILFDTARVPLIASNDIWEIVFKLTDETMYGLGEIPLEGEITKVIYSHRGGLSSIPLIYAKLNGSYHALLVDTVSPTELTIREDNRIIMRSITNLGMKFHLFVGPKPADILKDVMALLQVDNKLEYWMLGAHICSDPELTNLATLITNARTNNMPFESHCGNGPAIFNSECDDSYVTLIRSGATALRNAAKKFVPHVSPYILYTSIEEENYDTSNETTTTTPTSRDNINENRCFDDDKHKDYILADPSSEKLYIGSVDDEDVIYPVYGMFNDDIITEEFWKDMWVYGDVDAVVLENNWPLDESNRTDMYDYLPYYSENFEVAFETTPKWNATRPERYLYTHNKYGNEFASAFEQFKPVPIHSTSQWMNGNVVINRQKIDTSWSSLQREMVEMSLGGISGHRYWSSPICGDTENFNKTTQAELCAKWYMAATYFPMINIHSKNSSRDPLAFTGVTRTSMIRALNRRMSLMPYLYTVLQEGPLLRPMFYQYPLIEGLADLKTQFSVGDDLLIVPNLTPNQIQVHFTMPPGQWYELWSGLRISGNGGAVVSMATTQADFLTLIRGGSVLTLQKEVKLTTADTQKMSAYSIIIALNCETKNITDIVEESTTIEDNQTTLSTTVDGSIENRTETTEAPTTDASTTANPIITECSAKGKFYMSPNMTIVFKADDKILTITAEGDDFSLMCDRQAALWSPEVYDVDIYGLDKSHNNFDHHRHIPTFFSLCTLQNQENIIFNLI